MAITRVRIGLALVLALSLMPSELSREVSLDAAVRAALATSEPVSGVGVAVAVVSAGGTPFLRAYGLRDRALGLPVTPRTRFVLGSMTKAFTALALLMAEEDGRLDLAAPVQRLLPEFGLEDSEASRQASAIDLLSHQSGLPRHDCLWYLSDFGRGELLPRLRFLGFNLDPAVGFRKGFQYNNLGYLAAGQLLEAATGKSWEEYIRARILEPLGMSDTTVSLPELVKGPDVARGYWNERLLPYKDTTSIAPAAAVSSSAGDLSKWLGFLLRGGTTESGRALVSPEAFKKLFVPHIEAAAGKGVYYGLGWFVDRYAGHPWFRHVGNMDGFLGVISFLPDLGIGAVVLTNQNDTPVTSAVNLKVLETLVGPRGAQPAAKPVAAPRSQVMAVRSAPDRAALGRIAETEWEGSYSNAAYGGMRVERQGGGGLALRYGSRLWPMTESAPSAGSDATYTVLLDLGGRIQEFPLEFTRGKADLGAFFRVAFEENAKPFRFSR